MDLLEAAAKAVACTSKAVNMKKSQFLAPWDIAQGVARLVECGMEASSGRFGSPSAEAASATTPWWWITAVCPSCRPRVAR